MKNYMWGCLVVLCSACTDNPPVPPIEIEFESVSYVPLDGRFDIRFTSNEDLLKFFDVNAGRNQTYEGLTCYLGAKVDFSAGHGESNYLDGELVELDSTESQAKHRFSASLNAAHADHESGSITFISSKELLALLSDRNALACRFYASAYGYGRFYSKPMGVPTSVFVRVMPQEDGR